MAMLGRRRLDLALLKAAVRNQDSKLKVSRRLGEYIIGPTGYELRYSLAGQDTRPSPERPGFESRWRNLYLVSALAGTCDLQEFVARS